MTILGSKPPCGCFSFSIASDILARQHYQCNAVILTSHAENFASRASVMSLPR